MRDFKPCLCFQVGCGLVLFCTLLNSSGTYSFLAGTWQHCFWAFESPGRRRILHSPPPLHCSPSGLTQCQIVNAVSKRSLLAPEVTASGALLALDTGKVRFQGCPPLPWWPPSTLGSLSNPWLPPGEAACESRCFLGKNLSPSGRLGLQWKVDSKAVPGMWTFPGNFPCCLLENSRHQRSHTRSQLKKPKLLPFQ